MSLVLLNSDLSWRSQIPRLFVQRQGTAMYNCTNSLRNLVAKARLLFAVNLSLGFACDVLAVEPISCIAKAKISAESAHAAVLDRNCELWMWGFNNAGQLAGKPSSPKLFHRPNLQVRFTDIAVGPDHTVAISQDGRSYVWGKKEYLTCNTETSAYSYVPTPVTGLLAVKAIATAQGLNVFLESKGLVYEQGCLDSLVGEVTTVPRQIAGLPPIQAIAIGSSHRLALAENGEIWTWGSWNHFGQLGIGNQVATKQAVRIPGIPSAIAIAAGSWHSLVLDADGRVWAWGDNRDWQIGNSSADSLYLVPTIVQGLPKVKAIVAAWTSSAALTVDGRVFVWGNRTGNGYPTPTQIEGLENADSIYLGGNAAVTAGLFIIRNNGDTYRWRPRRRREDVPVTTALGELVAFPDPGDVPQNVYMSDPQFHGTGSKLAIPPAPADNR